ncbi:MAG: ABC-2 transporter permease [Erysipelotrichia bacterium]|nr:ABC-2 transporter permease [Erysipelotrichia bacterium]
MLGLIKKDILIIKSNLKLIIVMLSVFFIMSLQKDFDISFIPPFIVVMLFISTFSYDEYNKWDAYAVTLPNGRKNVVKAKYLASLILILLAVIITILLNCLSSIINNHWEFNEFISGLIGGTFVTILIQAIMYPLIFKLGIEKGRICLFALTFILTGLITLFSKLVKFRIPIDLIVFFNNYWYIILPLFLIIILSVSYKISEKIYSTKEF